MTQNGIIWFRLCGFSGLIYNRISFHRQKVQIQKITYIPPLQLSTDMDWQTAMLRKRNLCEDKGDILKSKSTLNHDEGGKKEKTAAALCRFNVRWRCTFGPHSVQLVMSQQGLCLWDVGVVINKAGCGSTCNMEESFKREKERERRGAAVFFLTWLSVHLPFISRFENWDILCH